MKVELFAVRLVRGFAWLTLILGIFLPLLLVIRDYTQVYIALGYMLGAVLLWAVLLTLAHIAEHVTRR